MGRKDCADNGKFCMEVTQVAVIECYTTSGPTLINLLYLIHILSSCRFCTVAQCFGLVFARPIPNKLNCQQALLFRCCLVGVKLYYGAIREHIKYNTRWTFLQIIMKATIIVMMIIIDKYMFNVWRIRTIYIHFHKLKW